MADTDFNLVIAQIDTAGRSFNFNEELTVKDDDEPEVISAYFAEKIITYEETTHQDPFTFKFADDDNDLTNKDDDLVNDAKRRKLASYILGKLKQDGDKKYTKNIEVYNALTKKGYKTNDQITIATFKKEKKEKYSKIKEAPMGYQVYLVAETKNLDGKPLKIKILESKSQNQKKENILKLVKAETDTIPVLVFSKLEDKTTTTQAGDWIEIDIKKQDQKILGKTEGTEIEFGIKKIQLRPKKDKKASKTEDAIKSFEGWQEALYIRENETEDGKKAIKNAEDAKTARKNEAFTTLTRDAEADKKENKKSYPVKISGPKTIEIDKVATYTIDSYGATATKADKNNIRWSLWVEGDKKTDYKTIDAKSKVGFYTYAKMELIGDKNQLTIVFDKALKGKKVQIEPFRGSPEINNKKDYVRTTIINEPATPKIIIRDKAHLYLKTECDSVVNSGEKINNKFLKGGGFKLSSSTTIYIYPDGKITNTYLKNGDKMRYVYVDSSKEEHDLGKTKIFTTKKHTKKNVLSKTKGDDIQLVYVKDVSNYVSGKVKFKFLTWNSSSGRWYINPFCFAGLLGAMIQESIIDLGFNGFSIKNGNTAGGSSSHINGEKGDLRYLNINKDGRRTILQDNSFDYVRQVKFNNALNKFGWGVTDKNYSEKFNYNGKETLLPHTQHKKKVGVYRHHHHLHLTGFKLNIY